MLSRQCLVPVQINQTLNSHCFLFISCSIKIHKLLSLSQPSRPAGLDRWGLCSHSPLGRKATGKADVASGSQDRAHSLQRDKWACVREGSGETRSCPCPPSTGWKSCAVGASGSRKLPSSSLSQLLWCKKVIRMQEQLLSRIWEARGAITWHPVPAMIM